MGFRDLARSFLDLIFGRRVGTGGHTASSARDAILNNRPLPVATLLPGGTGLPIAQHAPNAPQGRAVPPPLPNRQPSNQIPGGPIQFEATRWMDPRTAAPLEAWVSFRSTWILKARFDPVKRWEGNQAQILGSLYIQFLSFAMVRYDNVDAQIWQLLFASPSKGRWLYGCAIKRRDPWTQGYTLVMPPTRKVTAAIRQQNA